MKIRCDQYIYADRSKILNFDEAALNKLNKCFHIDCVSPFDIAESDVITSIMIARHEISETCSKDIEWPDGLHSWLWEYIIEWIKDYWLDTDPQPWDYYDEIVHTTDFDWRMS